jgi:hypothetical protein
MHKWSKPHKTHSQIHTRLKTSHARYHSFTPRVVDSLVQREGRDNIPKILGYARYHSFTLQFSSHKKKVEITFQKYWTIQNMIPSHLELVQIEGRDNISKILDYPRYDSFRPKIGLERK